LQKSLDYDFNLAMFDIGLPDIDGIDTVRTMRSLASCEYLPFILISSVYSENYFKTKGLGVGAIDFVTAPLDKDLLVEKVQVLLDLDLYRRKLEKEIELRKKAEKN